MKEKLKDLSQWLPTIILAILAVAIIAKLYFPLNNDKEPSIKNNQEMITVAEKETAAESKKQIEISEEDDEISADISNSNSYLLNTNSKKFHLIDCKSGQKTKETNRKYLSDRDAIIEMGYDPCKICNP